MGKRIIQQRRGAAKPRHLSPSHRHKGEVKYPLVDVANGKVVDIFHDPGHSSPIAKVEMEDGVSFSMLAAEGLFVGSEVKITDKTQIKPGFILPISKIPEGTPVYNLELRPGDGGKLVRSAGGSATVVSHDAEKTMVQLASGKFKNFGPNCRATIGVVSGGGRGDKPFLKAGKKFHALRCKAKRFPIVRGVAMNPIDHPHGGGSHNYAGGPTSIARGAPPGQKVGNIAPSRTGRRR
ncbi:MAG: 50S ribosomal protein L2 [Thermoplasmata archaeon HGW-Thermoplasmata-1]|nr:MAG: 50S ribosomal protein L2 [Thermoplasmata archaeon HGW-Thermoplasmata-1]